jgi:Domain of unknown function (DUF4276)
LAVFGTVIIWTLANMHLEILTEDQTTAALLDILLPKIIGENGTKHSWRLKPYKGIGRMPKNLVSKGDPQKRILLDQLPRLLSGYGKTNGIDFVIVVVDSDDRNCADFLSELKQVLSNCNPAPNTLFHLAIEETEAWYFGDGEAINAAYPKAKKSELNKYVQDSICGTWERLADALVNGGSSEVKKQGWPAPGELKHEWAIKIGQHMNPEINKSPSFIKLRDGLRRITQ